MTKRGTVHKKLFVTHEILLLKYIHVPHSSKSHAPTTVVLCSHQKPIKNIFAIWLEVTDGNTKATCVREAAPKHKFTDITTIKHPP